MSGFEWLQMASFLVMVLLTAGEMFEELDVGINGGIIWSVFLGIFIALNILPEIFMTSVYFIVSIVPLVLWLIFVFGTLQYLGAEDGIRKSDERNFSGLGNIKDTLTYFLALVLCSNFNRSMDNPKKSAPRVVIYCYVIFSVMCLVTFNLLSFQGPSYEIKGSVVSPVMLCLSRLFNSTYEHLLLLSLMPMLNLFINFFNAMNVLVTQLGNSGFLPPIFAHVYKSKASIILNILLVYAFTNIQLIVGNLREIANTVFAFTTYFTFFILMYCCLKFKKRYSSLKREFYSPFGIFGCYAGIIASLTGCVWILYFSEFAWTLVSILFYYYYDCILLFLLQRYSKI